MNKLILLVLLFFALLISNKTNASDFRTESLVKGSPNTNPNCPRTKRTICKTTQNTCETIYLNQVDSQECKEANKEHLIDVCGTTEPKFFPNEKACLDLPTAKNCPKSSSDINAENKDLLPYCPSLHAQVCSEACGSTYTNIDIRKDFYTNKESLICSDNEINPDRGECSEVHVGGGVRNWCIKIDLPYLNLSWGRDLQCAGRLQ